MPVAFLTFPNKSAAGCVTRPGGYFPAGDHQPASDRHQEELIPSPGSTLVRGPALASPVGSGVPPNPVTPGISPLSPDLDSGPGISPVSAMCVIGVD